MKAGETRKICIEGGFAILKKIRSGVYFLQDARTLRARWGNKQQIEEDIKHFESTGCLPEEKHSWY